MRTVLLANFKPMFHVYTPWFKGYTNGTLAWNRWTTDTDKFGYSYYWIVRVKKIQEGIEKTNNKRYPEKDSEQSFFETL